MNPANSKLIKNVWFDHDKAHCIFLIDGTKITVGRTRETKGPAWLEIGQAAKIVACSTGKITNKPTPAAGQV